MDAISDLLSAEASRQLLERGGYSSAEVDALTASGIFAVDRALLAPETRHRVMRSEPVDVFSPTMQIDEYVPLGDGVRGDCILLDTFTGSAITPLRLGSPAILGVKGFEPGLPHLDATPISYGRARFNAVPYFLAQDTNELDYLCTTFQAADPNHVFFRGQPREYLVRRDAAVRRFLFGSDAVREPSVPSAAFRHSFPYDAFEPCAQITFHDIEYRLTGKEHRGDWVEDFVGVEHVFTDQDGGLAAYSTSHTMAVAQHYGIPTYGLDVTRSHRIAWWFATWRLTTDGLSRYAPHQSSATDPHERPVIYVFRSTHTVDLGQLEVIARRPTVQKGLFLHGSWGPHGNLCAEDLVAVIILGQHVGIAPQRIEDMFPTEADDPVYAELLAMKRAWTDEPFASLLKWVYELEFE